jgi:hypothetical protein
MNINWQSYDGKFFQRFCNALLSLEVSKSFVPFSAPGRDGGIDGLYSGTYDGMSGEWRFQDKFHKTARKESYNSIKAEIKLEIQKLASENHFIILTNVGLLPQEKKELQLLAQKELVRIKKANVYFDVWDDAKIHTLYIRHPILRLWMEEGFTTAQLISYQDYFGKRLDVGIDDPSTLANEFIARESEINLLKEFVNSGGESIAVVSGEAGIGKTRLAVEFFKTYLDKLNEWQTLVLNSHRINFEKVAFVLSSDKNTMVLVDDAHNFTPEVIADLRNLTRLSLKRKLKFILTGRRVLIDHALELIPTVEDRTIRYIPLGKLSPDDTRVLFQRQTNIGRYKDYIPALVSTSNGRPILIVALLRAIHQNVQIPKIKDESVLKDYVREYFNTVLQVVSKYTGVSELKIDKLLRLICLLEPLPISDDSFNTKLAEFSEVNIETIRYLMDRLLTEGLALKRHELAISPDYYSDIILATADQAFVVSGIATFPKFISNIIVNLTAVDEAYDEETKGSLGLDSILTLYISQIEHNNSEVVQDILHTMSSIAYQKPEFGKLTIRLFVQRLKLQESQSFRDLLMFDIDTRSTNHKSLYGSISWLLHNLLYRQGNEKFVFDAVVTIYSFAPDLGLFNNTFALDKRHVMHGYNFREQHLFITEALSLLQMDDSLITFFLDAFKDFLKLEFTISSADPFKVSQINLTTFFIPADEKVVALRKKVIDALITIYNSTSKEEIKKRVVHELMDVPRGISASTRSKSPYTSTDEIVYILKFIESKAESMPLAANREVVNRLYWIQKWGANDQVVSRINSLRKALEPQSLPEKILFLLNNMETRIDHDYKNLVDHMVSQSKKLINEYGAEEIAHSLATVRKIQESRHEFLWAFNRALCEDFAAKTMVVYDRLWIIDREFIYLYGSEFLSVLRFKHDQSDFYWAKIEELELDASAQSLNVILYVYNKLTKPIGLRDVELVERIFSQNKENSQISFNLFMALVTLSNSGHDRSNLIVSLFDISHQRAVDNFLTFNRDIDGDLLKELVLSHSARFQLSFDLQHALASLLERHLISEGDLFEYFLLRFKIKSQQISKNDYRSYEFMPHDNFNMFASMDEAQKTSFFMRGLTWYVNAEYKGMEDYYAKDFLEFLQQSKEITPELAEEYVKHMQLISDPKQLQRIITSIDIFERKTKTLIDLVIDILKKGREMQGIELDRLRASAYSAITTVGVKSGAVGEPFPVDIELRDLLNEWISEHPGDEVAIEFLNKVVHSIDQEIMRSTDREEKLW